MLICLKPTARMYCISFTVVTVGWWGVGVLGGIGVDGHDVPYTTVYHKTEIDSECF